MEKGLTEPDKEAAQHLVQLSGGNEEEESKGLEHNDRQKKKEKEKEEEGEEIRDEISERGKEEEEEDEHRPRKKQRFRSLASIYEATKPITNEHHGSRRSAGKEERKKDQDIRERRNR
ncbi:histone H3.v1 [Cocos nucifera]|uniref:Histone H3.v1 n=1 Tax=Cocos nucifera TaxID=13894 RepID=A0A8K0MVJ1_COCNU|nr:histone H3.v1 [Cocos nucifera]